MDVGSVLDTVGSAVVSGASALLLNQLSNILRIDHPLNMEFAVEIDGVTDCGFISCEGLSDRSTSYQFVEGNKQIPTRIPGYKRQIGRITLEKGITFQGKLEKWYYDTIGFQRGGKSPLRDVSVVQLMRMSPKIPFIGNQLVEVKRWEIRKCYIVDLTFPKFRATDKTGISMLKCVLESTDHNGLQMPIEFGPIGTILDAITK